VFLVWFINTISVFFKELMTALLADLEHSGPRLLQACDHEEQKLRSLQVLAYQASNLQADAIP
jgi:hypothetical protein